MIRGADIDGFCCVYEMDTSGECTYFRAFIAYSIWWSINAPASGSPALLLQLWRLLTFKSRPGSFHGSCGMSWKAVKAFVEASSRWFQWKLPQLPQLPRTILEPLLHRGGNG